MSNFTKQASKEQLEVIKSETVNHSPIVVVAGAGSGKTTTIINKMGFSIENGIKPNDILALSFSNKSAKEITDRVKEKLGTMANGLQAGTFHSIALKLLKAHSPEFQYIKILDSDDDKKYIKKIYDKHYGEKLKEIKQNFKEGKIEEDEYMYQMSLISSVSDIQWCISRSKNTNENIFDIIFAKIIKKEDNIAITKPEKYNYYKSILFSKEEHTKFIEEVIKFSKEFEMPELFFLNIKYAIRVMREYEENKQRDKYFSFDDLLINIVGFLQQNEIIRKKIDEKYKYIYVDEFQDVNYIQFEFIKLINQDYNYLIVVGDADQAIYSFRGCDSYYFTNMKNIYPKTRIYSLNDNYRSDGHIVALANASIENNQLRYEKVMNNIKPISNVPKLFSTYHENELFYKIAQQIKEQGNYNETAILYRNNMHSYQIQKKLIELKVPFKVVGGQNILNKKYSKDIRALLSLTISLDIISLERVITIYPKIGAKTAEKIINSINVAIQEQKPLEEQLLPLKSNSKLVGLYDLLTKYNSGKINLLELLNLFQRQVLHDDIYKKVAPDKIEAELDNIDEIINLIGSLYSENYSLDEILEMITLDDINDNKGENKEMVTLSTIHRSKGLEWDNVYIIKAYKFIFPSFQSVESQFLLEEERNLFYVAVTRAKENLYICQADVFETQFDEKIIIPSMFVDEIQEFLE